MRVALVYDRLNKTGGAERVLEAFNELYPAATWYTSVWDKAGATFSRSWHVHSSWLSHLPWVRRHHEYFPFLMPFIFESFDFSNYDLVISIGSAECKGVITKPETFHLHYCLTPTRYLYSHQSQYLTNTLYRALAKPLRAWDLVAATRPDKMIAISTQVKKRIKQYYHRDSELIFPPVNTTRFRNPVKPTSLDLQGLPHEYFVVVSRLVPYKNIDLIIRAFAKIPHKHLVIVGKGSEENKLKRIATPNVHFLGAVIDTDLPSIYHGATAYIQANEEDFGISMVEAQASGIPIIAYGSGGALDIVIPGKTGILLPVLSVDSLKESIDNFADKRFDKEVCRKNAQRFDVKVWKQKMKERIESYVNTK